MDATAGTGDGQANGQHQQCETQQRSASTSIPTSPPTARLMTDDANADSTDVSLIVHAPSGERSHPHLTTRSGSAAGGSGAGQVKFGIGNEDTSMLELFPVLGVSQGGRLKIDWETEKEAGLAIRPEESLFDLVHKSSRFTELVMSGKSIAAALGLLHSGTRLLDSENAARRSMSPLESKMYEAWKNGATLPSLALLSPSATSASTTHRDRLSQRFAPDDKQRALALGQLYKLTDGERFSGEQLQAFERQYPQLLPLVSAKCKVLSVDDNAGLLRSDRVAAECLALRKTINMMDGALNDIVAMIANAVQTVNETSELLRARLEGLTLGTAPCEVHSSQTDTYVGTACDYQQSVADSHDHQDPPYPGANGGLHANNGTNDDHMVDEEPLDEHHTSEKDLAHCEEDDAMSEDQDTAAVHVRSSSPTVPNVSSELNEDQIEENAATDGMAASNEAQSGPASEVSDADRVERLLSDPPEGSAQTGHIVVEGQAGSAGLQPDTQDGGGQGGATDFVPRRPETNSVADFMSLGKKPTLAPLPNLSHTSSSERRQGGHSDTASVIDADADAATQKTQDGAAAGQEGGESANGGGGKSLPFAPAGSSGRGSTPFVISGRRE